MTFEESAFSRYEYKYDELLTDVKSTLMSETQCEKLVDIFDDEMYNYHFNYIIGAAYLLCELCKGRLSHLQDVSHVSSGGVEAASRIWSEFRNGQETEKET